tara:strand:- start:600 stop:848 length:249 start_codon:yes stop_codon:yes gene_type:complete
MTDDIQLRMYTRQNGRDKNYIFQGVHNDRRGRLFLKMINQYLNKETYGYRKYWRGKGSWRGSLSQDKADSYVMYIEKKEKWK